MDEDELRELGTTLRGELGALIADEQQREATAVELDAALTLPSGEAKQALVRVLRARRQTREWVAARIDFAPLDQLRAVVGPLGRTISPLGVHMVCPNCDYDTVVETPTAQGRCPNDGRKLVRATDE